MALIWPIHVDFIQVTGFARMLPLLMILADLKHVMSHLNIVFCLFPDIFNFEFPPVLLRCNH